MDSRGTFSVYNDATVIEKKILKTIYKNTGDFSLKDFENLKYSNDDLRKMIKKGFSIYEHDEYIDFTCTASCMYAFITYTPESNLEKNMPLIGEEDIVTLMFHCLKKLE